MAHFERTLTVQKADLDELEHVNNVRYLHWIQELSREHWEALAPNAIRRSVAWVVVHHDITYRNAARLHDVLNLKTFITDIKGASSTRVVEITGQRDHRSVVRSVTEWCLLDLATFRPMRISGEIAALFRPQPN